MKEVTAQNNHLALSFILSVCAFGTSIIIGLYVYRYSWGALTHSDFAVWFSIFEVSQFLLLLDLGFTHRHIADRVQENPVERNNSINGLRFVLLIAASAAALILLLIIFWFSKKIENIHASLLLLAGSLFLNILSYAETAELRKQGRNNEIYIISIVSQIVFVVILATLHQNAGLAIGFAVFVRSLVVYAMQIYKLKEAYSPKCPSKNLFGGSVVAINFAYFSLFMLDASLLGLTKLGIATIGVAIAVKKYFDLLRSLWDNILPNLFIYFKKPNDKKVFAIIISLCIISYIMALFFSKTITSLWLDNFSADYSLYAAFMLSFLGISIFRFISIRMFYKNMLDWKEMLKIAVLTKSIFIIFLLCDQRLETIYMIQGIMLIVCIMSCRMGNIKATGN